MHSSLSSQLAQQHIALLRKQADSERLANQARAARRQRRRPQPRARRVTARVTGVRPRHEPVGFRPWHRKTTPPLGICREDWGFILIG
jgi:hypothetical protein